MMHAELSVHVAARFISGITRPCTEHVTFCPVLPHCHCTTCACLQEGVFRVNCVDCLDRTNVVQGLLGRHALEGLLGQLGVLGAGEELAAVLPQVRAGCCILVCTDTACAALVAGSVHAGCVCCRALPIACFPDAV
jgi:hypothetical protein